MIISLRFSRRAGLVLAIAVAAAPALAWAWEPVSLTSDPLVRMPGTQPSMRIFIEPASACASCHSGYSPAVEPGFLWKGSMMAQSARDPFFWAGLTVAAQDSIWAFGTPNGADICERCHMPKGWLELRSDPPNALSMAGADYDGVQCDVCHKMVDPFFEDTWSGSREGADWTGYWDETGASGFPSQAAADATRAEDTAMAASVTLFNGQPFYTQEQKPVSPVYTENVSGQYFVSTGDQKRGSFADASALHPMLYSRYHKSKHFCASCHDVSNPLVENLPFRDAQPGDGSTVLPTEEKSGSSYSHIERTFSEFMLSDYGLPAGSPGTGPFAPAVFTTSHPGNAIATCQDCHMADTSGAGCKIFGSIDRPSGSVEHPSSGQPTHDLTGGNALIPFVLSSVVPGSPSHDPINEALLDQGAAALTLDLQNGLGLDPIALLAGRNRALAQLGRSASIEGVAYDPVTGALSFRIRNHTGHKLISGYPEGRRMFVNVRLSSGGSLIHEVNPYDNAIGTLRGLDPAYSPSSPPLGPSESYVDSLVYEAHMQSALTGEPLTFHFVLATGRAKDNRIPPKGFRINEAPARMAEPVAMGAPAIGLYSAEEYAGGYDDVTLTLPPGGSAVEVRLLYQTTSREYVEFLRDEITGAAASLASPTPSGEPAAYIAQTDPFFTQLRKWGDTIWQLWLHNKDAPGAAPVVMAKASLVAKDICMDAGTPAGALCDDGDACTTGDSCLAGACAGGPPPSCEDGNPCTDDACEQATGCTHTPISGTCDDASLCTFGDTCAFGLCVGAVLPCDDSDPCTDDACDPAGGCVFTVIAGCSPGAGGGGAQGGAAGQGGQGSVGGQGGAVTGTGGQSGSASMGGQGGVGAGSPGDVGGCSCTIVGASRAPRGISEGLILLLFAAVLRRACRRA